MTTLNKRPILPPRGVFSPSAIVYDKSLAPTVRDTYTMMRGLAWGKSETPPLSFEQIEEITGKSRATIYGHMRELDARGALRWRSAGDARLIVSFFDLDELGDEQQLDEGESESRNLESRNLDLPDDDVLKESLNHHLESRNLEKIQKTGQPVQKSGQKIQKPGFETPVIELDEGFGRLVKLWESIRGPIAPFEADEIKLMINDWDSFAASMPEGHHTKAVSAEAAISEAMRTTARQARSANMKYAKKVFTSFMTDGVPGLTASVSAPTAPVVIQPPAAPEDPGQYAPMPDSAKRALEALLRKREASNVAG